MPSPRDRLDVHASTAMELLVALFALGSARPAQAPPWLPAGAADCSPRLRRELEAVGARAGELWLHLLGLALELRPASAGEFVERLAGVDGLELRRHVLGVYVPAWRTVAGLDTLERAARGSTAAARTLLEHDTYYAGRARESLERVLSLTAARTKRVLLGVLRRFHEEVFAPQERDVRALLEADAAQRRARRGSVSREALIVEATGGYHYEPEPELARVLLVPQVSARPWLLLCQHADTRIICYPAAEEAESPEAEVAERSLRLGVALADERRVAIVRRLARGDATLAELAEVTGLAKSTAHHHLGHLRAAGLISLHGNARGYRFSLRAEGFAEARELLAALVSTP